jgi:hypothetical protein
MLGSIDLGDGVVENGGCKKIVVESNGLFQILYHHDPTRQIGFNVEGYEDERELFVPGLLNVNVTAACERNSFMKMAQILPQLLNAVKKI